MKVKGELEGASLEQIAATTTTPAYPGRIYMDVTTPTAAIPRVYDGSNWRALGFAASSSSVVTQNSGTACTVDWSKSLVQQVVLTGDALISFVNPQVGAQHILMITQGASSGISSNYGFTLNMIDQDSRRGWYQPKNFPQANENSLFAWTYYAGVKPAYATVPNVVFAPSSAPGSSAPGAIDISPDGKTIVVPNATSPYNYYYDLYDGAFKPAFGLKNKSTPTTLVGSGVAAAYSPDGAMVFIANATTPYLQGLFLGAGNIATGTAVAPTALAGAANCVDVHPLGSHVIAGHATTPFMTCLPYNSLATGVFGPKITNPVTVPAAAVTSVAFSPQGDYVAAASQTTPFLQVWPFTPGASGAFGGIINPTAPAGGPAGSLGKGVMWRPQGDYIALAMTTTPYLAVLPFNRAAGTFGTALSISALGGAANCVNWTPDGQYLLVGLQASPYLAIFDFSSATVGSAITFDGSNPGQTVNDIAVSPGGDWAVLSLNASVYLTGVMLPNKVRNYLRLVM